MTRAEILIVDDEPDIRRLVQEILRDENYDTYEAENAEAARDVIDKHHPDLVLLDIWMPGTDGISLLKEWTETGSDLPVVMMSGHGTVETAVEATRLGAYDFIEKPLSMAKLLVTVDRALENSRLAKEHIRLKARIDTIDTLTGHSEIMNQLRTQVEQVGRTDAWVLIQGEAGTGKTVAGRCLHRHSSRAENPLVEINLAASPNQNMSTVLFGHETGSGIVKGKLEEALGGTLLLAGIDGLDKKAQAALARALKEKQFLRVGGTRAITLDARIVATTNEDLEQAAKNKVFREDLYYRLNAVPMHMPSLREHPEDVPELIKFFVDWLTEKKGLPYRKFSVGAVNAMRNHTWPGNIRELKNMVQRLLMINLGPEVEAAEVVEILENTQPEASSSKSSDNWFMGSLRESRDSFEKAYLEHHLAKLEGNVSALAEISGMERTHLYRKLKQLGINPKELKGKE